MASEQLSSSEINSGVEFVRTLLEQQQINPDNCLPISNLQDGDRLRLQLEIAGKEVEREYIIEDRGGVPLYAKNLVSPAERYDLVNSDTSSPMQVFAGSKVANSVLTGIIATGAEISLATPAVGLDDAAETEDAFLRSVTHERYDHESKSYRPQDVGIALDRDTKFAPAFLDTSKKLLGLQSTYASSADYLAVISNHGDKRQSVTVINESISMGDGLSGTHLLHNTMLITDQVENIDYSFSFGLDPSGNLEGIIIDELPEADEFRYNGEFRGIRYTIGVDGQATVAVRLPKHVLSLVDIDPSKVTVFMELHPGGAPKFVAFDRRGQNFDYDPNLDKLRFPSSSGIVLSNLEREDATVKRLKLRLPVSAEKTLDLTVNMDPPLKAITWAESQLDKAVSQRVG